MLPDARRRGLNYGKHETLFRTRAQTRTRFIGKASGEIRGFGENRSGLPVRILQRTRTSQFQLLTPCNTITPYNPPPPIWKDFKLRTNEEKISFKFWQANNTLEKCVRGINQEPWGNYGFFSLKHLYSLNLIY